jgi:hypothetical protein
MKERNLFTTSPVDLNAGKDAAGFSLKTMAGGRPPENLWRANSGLSPG